VRDAEHDRPSYAAGLRRFLAADTAKRVSLYGSSRCHDNMRKPYGTAAWLRPLRGAPARAEPSRRRGSARDLVERRMRTFLLIPLRPATRLACCRHADLLLAVWPAGYMDAHPNLRADFQLRQALNTSEGVRPLCVVESPSHHAEIAVPPPRFTSSKTAAMPPRENSTRLAESLDRRHVAKAVIADQVALSHLFARPQPLIIPGRALGLSHRSGFGPLVGTPERF